MAYHADDEDTLRLEFSLEIHQLRPWPLSGGATGGQAPQLLAIGWQRGKRKGHIAAVKPKVTSKAYAVYPFNDTLNVVARLKRAGPTASFEKKFLQLAIVGVKRTPDGDKPRACYGTVVINLADFADVSQDAKKLAFRVSVSKAISTGLSQIGKPDAPSLIITIRSKDAATPLPPESDASWSSRGSRITSDLSAFFTNKIPGGYTTSTAMSTSNPVAATSAARAVAVLAASQAPPPPLPAIRIDSDGFEIDDDIDGVGSGVRPSVTPRGLGGTEDHSVSGRDIAAGKAVMDGATAESRGPNGAGAVRQDVAAAGEREDAFDADAFTAPNNALPAFAGFQVHRTTGKTGFIKDWLGAAEPAPGVGPSVRFHRDEEDDATGERPSLVVLAPAAAEPEAAEQHATLDDVAVQRSVRGSNHDLRMILEKSRLREESESLAAVDVEKKAASRGGNSAVVLDAEGMGGESGGSGAGRKNGRLDSEALLDSFHASPLRASQSQLSAGAAAAAMRTAVVTEPVAGPVIDTPGSKASLPSKQSVDGAAQHKRTASDASRKSARSGLQWKRNSTSGQAGMTSEALSGEVDSLRREAGAMQAELLVVGLLESAMRSPPPAGTGRSQTHVSHTLARRLFRSTLALPHEQAARFVDVALREVRQRSVLEWREDVTAALRWWTNVQLLRLFLHHLEQGEISAPGDWSWLRPMMDSQLVEIAAEIFDKLVDSLWVEALLPVLSRSAGRKAHAERGPGAQEDNMLRWIGGLDVANDRLASAAPRVQGFSSLLLPLVQAALIARIDFLFFQNILSVGSASRGESAFGSMGWIVPPHLLPFSMEGRVSFQTGMQLKMAVMHLMHWAHDHGLGGLDDSSLYPYIRSVADTLMMKKDLLTDAETRRSVCSALDIHSLVHLLTHFSPDEFSSSPVDPVVLQHLKAAGQRAPKTQGASLPGYTAPLLEELQEMSVSAVAELQPRRRGRLRCLAQVEMEIGDDSDAELQDLSADRQGLGIRYQLVQELWAASYDRRDE